MMSLKALLFTLAALLLSGQSRSAPVSDSTLSKRGFDDLSCDDSSWFNAAKSGNFTTVFKCLEQEPKMVDMVNENNSTALMLAFDNEQVGIAQLLIQKGANVNQANKDGETPLMYAIHHRLTKLAIETIHRGAYVNAKTSSHFTALMSAAADRNDDVLKLLIQKGADINAKDIKGRTALDFAQNKAKQRK